MHIIQINNVTINHAGRLIFKELSWVIGDRDRVGLIGPNGAGKSSLLKAIMGEVQPDAGSIVRMRGISVGYLPQTVTLTPGIRLIEEAMILPPALAQVEAELGQIEARMSDPAVYNDETALAQVMAEQEKALERYERLGGALHANKVNELLTQLGFTPADHDLPTEALSGGQKKLVALVRLMVEQPDVLLLDEPDNHLDLEAKARLEAVVRSYNGGVVIVSHDRYLLDECVNQIAELENGKLTLYVGNYSMYALEREARRQRQQQMYVAQQKWVKRMEERIHEWDILARADNEKAARRARSRRKMLERMEANGEMVERVTDRKALELTLAGGRGSTKALELKQLTMGFDDDLLFADLDLLVRHGERVGLVGRNGAGKSVLFKLLLGELTPLDGEIKIGPSTKVGYYAQEHQTLTAWWDKSALDFIRDVSPAPEGAAVAFLLKMLFSYEQVRMPIGTLSGGERSRLQLAALMLTRPNLLLLDEPTNNLDIPSSEALETALEDFEGALVVISHDRYFLDRVVDRVAELGDGSLRQFEGGYTDFLDAKPKRK
ncbi:MAG TPA: ABC-F family ATP-binding cassette domain-containing protein [Phototrophicaceae bacterium]|nr:ABC-F family ATP-binding cassette domain-containing protein [Phototrophicaceae bacterium]